MTEWTIVGVIVTLIGLVTAIIKPLITLNSVITRLTEVVKHMETNLCQLTEKNSLSHGQIWEHLGRTG